MLNKQKKYLGQHFLKNKTILEEMARAAEISKKDIVLEVGPGSGSLTEILAERAGKVIAVEKDRDLIPYLHKKLKNFKNVKIVEGDILAKAVKPPLGGLTAKSYKIVANIPYYITSRFLRMFLSNPKLRPKLMVLMVQREVADRILARDKKPACRQGRESLLSLSVKAYARAEIIRRVSKNLFSPPPKVDSAIIKISLRRPTSKSEQILALAKLAFQQKRKMLRHSLPWLSDSQVARKRPEELSLEDWAKIVVK